MTSICVWLTDDSVSNKRLDRIINNFMTFVNVNKIVCTNYLEVEIICRQEDAWSIECLLSDLV